MINSKFSTFKYQTSVWNVFIYLFNGFNSIITKRAKGIFYNAICYYIGKINLAYGTVAI